MFTNEQIRSLATDDASHSAGLSLSVINHWSNIGADDSAIWGECKGSGKNPYKTSIDLGNLAFKCSCPSRKFPCKHAIGLMIMHANSQTYFSDKNQPLWVNEWLEKRTSKSESADKTSEPAAKNPKTIEARKRKVASGVEEVINVLKDIARNGMMDLPANGQTLFSNLAKRMVDAQAPGLSAIANQIEDINYYDENWSTQLTDNLLKLFLIADTYPRHVDEDTILGEELRMKIGFPKSKEELESEPGITDEWMVLSTENDHQAHLQIQKTWMIGSNTCKVALFLQFYIKSQMPEFKLLPGTKLEADLVFYPGIASQRVNIKRQGLITSLKHVNGHKNIPMLKKAIVNEIIENPFFESTICLINDMRFGTLNDQWYLKDMDANSLLIEIDPYNARVVLAVTGGQLFDACLSVKGNSFKLSGFLYNENYYEL